MDDNNLPPPSYNKHPGLSGIETSSLPSPEYTPPKTFKIGSRRTSTPLVNSAQIKGHLALLRAFAELKTQVDGLDGHAKASLPQMPDDIERRWGWFVGLAVERFTSWCINLLESLQETTRIREVLPPIDVVMVWHAYMLNPGWYTEDNFRISILQGLKYIGEDFAKSLDQPGVIVSAAPSPSRVHNWTSLTSMPFDPLESAAIQVTKSLHCPYSTQHMIRIPLMNDEGTGYLQHDFSTHCSYRECEGMPLITREILAIRKLAGDIVYRRSGPAACFAGTLHNPDKPDPDTERSEAIGVAAMKHPSFERPLRGLENTWMLDIMQKNKYSLLKMKTSMQEGMLARGGKIINRIFSAYVDDRHFSVDLVGAVLRQGNFVRKMRELHWTEPSFFDSREDEIALQHAIARYHAFLDLMTTSPATFFVPTLDIDLAWHTHQLTSTRYGEDCRRYVGRFIDHDDKVEEARLASAFDLTCRAWKSYFGVRYTHCGCPLPGDTIGQKLSRLLVSYSANVSYLNPPNREDLLAATHPSDHNAVFPFHNRHASERDQRARRKKFARRQKRDAELVAKGKLDSKTADRSLGHDPAFLVPVPYYFYYGPAVGCAVGTGGVVTSTSGVGGCSAGAGGCGVAGGSGCGSGGDGGGGGSGGGCGGCGG